MKILLAAAASSLLLAAPASAQSLGDLLGLANQASWGVQTMGADGCVYQQGIARALCSANRLAQGAATAQRVRAQYEQQRRQEQEDRLRADQQHASTQMQLAGLCRQGDPGACRAAEDLARADAGDGYRAAQAPVDPLEASWQAAQARSQQSQGLAWNGR